jgi:hypothetical protein
MDYTATLTVSKEDRNFIERAMAGLDDNFRLDELVASFEVEFNNGIVGLISVISGNEDNVGYVDACLIDGADDELAILPAAIDNFTGKYMWEVARDIYTLNIVVE